MSANISSIYDVKREMLAKYPRFGSEIAVANIEFRDDLPFHTAATDGKNIYVDSNYFESLNKEERLFVIAHEIMHIKFLHMFRLKDKEGKKRNPELWNIATDAIINANLERDGFKVKKGYVNMPEALNYSAEEFYQKLLEEQEKKKNKEQGEQSQNQDGGQSQEQDDGQEQSQNQNDGQGQNQGKDDNEQENENSDQGRSNKNIDDHSLWEEAFNKQQQQNSQIKETTKRCGKRKRTRAR